MSFYSDASLVMIPSGYKTSKVYSAVPTDGTGDLTFTRSNDTATRVGPDGLIEKVQTNLVLQSNTFSNASWTKTGGTTLTAGQADYLGGTNAWKWEATGTGTIQLAQSPAGATIRTSSIYAKAGSVSTLNLWIGSAVTFNLSTGTVTSGTGVITSVGNGWYRCSAFGTGVSHNPYFASATAGDYVLISFAQLEEGDIATDYIATTTAAVSVGPVSGLPRLDYLGSTCPRLLLEPQTTALNQFSESFDNSYWQLKTDVTISANSTDTLDPSGYYGADKITETATTARHRVAANAATLTTANHTASVFMKKGTARYGFVTFSAGTVFTIVVDLENGTITATSTSGTIVAQKVENYGNGWYRISVTGLSAISGSSQYNLQFGSAGSATPSYNANIPSFAGSASNYLYAWGANLTATSYLQSYIPTLSTSVTRVADAASKSGITSLIGQTEGTLFAEFEINANNTDGLNRIFSVTDGTLTSRVLMIANTDETFRFVVSVASSSVVNITTSTSVLGGRHKVAFAYKASDYVAYVDGVQVGSNTAVASVPASLTTAYVGTNEGGAAASGLEGTISQALLFTTRLSNADLAALTA